MVVVVVVMMYRVATKCPSVVYSADDKNNCADSEQFVLSTAASGAHANRMLYVFSLNTAVVKGRPGRYMFPLQ